MIEGGTLTQEALMRIRTIGFIVTLALGLLAVPLATEAQQAGKMYRIALVARMLSLWYTQVCFRSSGRESQSSRSKRVCRVCMRLHALCFPAAS